MLLVLRQVSSAENVIFLGARSKLVNAAVFRKNNVGR